jgi:hypothetical protein
MTHAPVPVRPANQVVCAGGEGPHQGAHGELGAAHHRCVCVDSNHSYANEFHAEWIQCVAAAGLMHCAATVHEQLSLHITVGASLLP